MNLEEKYRHDTSNWLTLNDRVDTEILLRGLWKLWVLFEQKYIKFINGFLWKIEQIMQHFLKMQ